MRKRTHRRARRTHPGSLIQIDALHLNRFGGSQKSALHGALDDAAEPVVGLYMTQNECLFGYLEKMRQCCSGTTTVNQPKSGRAIELLAALKKL